MIDVTIFYEEGTRGGRSDAGDTGGRPRDDLDGYMYTGFAIRGHAGAAPKGSDVVCAAVSSVSQMVTLGLLEISRRYPEVRVWFVRDEGRLECVFRGPRSGSSGSPERHSGGEELRWPSIMASFLVEMLEATVRQIADQYPSKVSVKRERYEDIAKSGGETHGDGD
ncbi:MAG TPA: ribosomal-processing cysteine protease Prp [Clostridia bacterium]|nr:ribosomal-processing cysteine protease Prp [Clostridia bacterium]